MRWRRLLPVVAGLLVAGLLVPADAAPIGGCRLFPSDNYWYADVSGLPVHPQSDAWIRSIGLDRTLKADFGAGFWDGSRIGIPFNTANARTLRYTVRFDYDDESDHLRYPIPARPRIEGGSDHHLLTVDTARCRLTELYAVRRRNGQWRAGSGAAWDLRSNALRPAGWTSADAAGLPILPGLVRWNEAASGVIDHAIRFTAPETRTSYVWPARHQAGSGADASLPPMGAWFRLRADVDLSGYHGVVRTILEALRTHGMILADNGSPWYLSGVPNERWSNDALRALGDLDGRDFEAVDVSSLMVSAGSGQVAP